MNYVVITKLLDEPSKVHNCALVSGSAVFFEISSKLGVIKDFVADVGIFSNALHLVFKVSCNAEIDQVSNLSSITSESSLVVGHHRMNMAFCLREPHVT